MQSVLLARVLSHMPPERMGIERRKVRKFSKPIKWLLVLMFFFFFLFLTSLMFECEVVFGQVSYMCVVYIYILKRRLLMNGLIPFK